MGRKEQVNELLHQHLAQIVNKEVFLENGLITISYIDCSPDLKSAKVAVSVLPEGLAGSALEKLRKTSGQIVSALSKKIKLRVMPRLNWTFDPTEKKAAVIDDIFEEIERERKQ